MIGYYSREEFKYELWNLDFIQKGNLILCDFFMYCVFDYWFMVFKKKISVVIFQISYC